MRKRIRVVAALIVRDGKVLIAQRAAKDSFPGKWEFPGGKVRDGETHRDALKRELHEELGVEAQIGEQLVELNHDYAQLSVNLIFYRGVLNKPSMPKPLVHQELAWVTAGEARNYDFLEADGPLIAKLENLISTAG